MGCGPTRAQDLINAVNAANTAGGGSIVPAGALCTYTFTGPDAPTNHLNALPVITTPITITGPWRRPHPDGCSPVFEVSSTGNLSLNTLNLKGGKPATGSQHHGS